MPNAINLRSDDLLLEARLVTQSKTRAALVTHPHPLYGGDMHNPVVATIARTYEKMGWTTLRFNFRGTGASRGRFDEGIGEQHDLQAAISYLQDQRFETIDLAGYSFGAWIIARWSQSRQNADHRIFFVAPPVAFLDFKDIQTIPGLQAVFTGSRDPFGPPEQIRSRLPLWQPRAELHLIQGADHFFAHQADQLQAALAASL